MSSTVNWLALALAAVGLWLLFGLFGAVRDALAQRAAGWLLPAGQPVTFRLAQLLAILVRRLAPKRSVRFDLSGNGPYLFPLSVGESRWVGPEEAVVELTADLEAERRAFEPLRLVGPLFAHTFYLHVRNGFELVRCVLWCPLGIIAFFCLALVFTPILLLMVHEMDKLEQRELQDEEEPKRREKAA